jgi:hypothetical protein
MPCVGQWPLTKGKAKAVHGRGGLTVEDGAGAGVGSGSEFGGTPRLMPVFGKSL